MRTGSIEGRRRVRYVSVTMKPKRTTQKDKPKKFSTKAELLAELLPRCEEEHRTAFGRRWSPDRMARIEALTQRWRVEGEAWRVMYEFRKVAAKALDFFKSQGLDPNKPDNGLFHAYRLHKIVKQHRRFLESLVNEVREDYRRPADRRHWLAWSMNFAKPNAFAKLPQDLPYGRVLSNRELAILGILMTGGEEVVFTRGMTVSGAIEQELRRMARAAERAPSRGGKKVGTREMAAPSSDDEASGVDSSG